MSLCQSEKVTPVLAFFDELQGVKHVHTKMCLPPMNSANLQFYEKINQLRQQDRANLLNAIESRVF